MKILKFVAVLFFPSWALAAGPFVPPPNAQFSWVAEFAVTCNDPQSGIANRADLPDPAQAAVGPMNEALFSESYQITPNAILNLVNRGLSNAQITLSDQTLLIRGSEADPWVALGHYQVTDVQDYCQKIPLADLSSDRVSPARLPLVLENGTTFQISRKVGFSFCVQNFETGSYSRSLEYDIKLSDAQGQKTEFVVKGESLLRTKEECTNFNQGAWVPAK